ncbi:glycoside hydrolase family 3 protein [Pseudoalteromonas haloplanktis]|uniref:Glycoside hydrolase family 3 protein n=1 Tax=Pseudoalteromonas haloplanktis TaxID=228 RepID=A0ABU1BHY7_PSEHA|nr:glycoside hydrolase family 3 protein [Pseudoalteromonas haloplanktis]MDQ9093207.1 glycoside hydrolase family 3 protein [Pseudoalteromonas haloplanktis]
MKLTNKIKQLLNSLPIEEKVGQLFVLAFAGEDYDYALQLVKQYHVGGFYITDDNAHDIRSATQLAATLQQQAALRACDAPLLLAVDQEGAWGILTQQTDVGPGNLALGKANDIKLTEQMYRVFAEQMQAIGYNTLLSPCADVNANPRNPIIGQRAFGETANLVSEHVSSAVRGILNTDNFACAKHFPGHGDTHTDSHQALPVVDKSLATLLAEDLAPFIAAIDAGVSMIMTSHINYPQIDPQYPATLSHTILTDILKHQLGFKGLIITDSMNMWAMRKNYQPAQAAILALQAGAHLIMLSEEHYENSTTPYKQIQAQTIQGVIDAVKCNALDITVIDRALEHVLRVKYSGLKAQATTMTSTESACKAIATTAAKQAVQIVRNTHQHWPLQDPHYYLAFAADPKGYDSLVNARGIGPNDPRSAREVILANLNSVKRQFTAVSFVEFKQLLNAEAQLKTADKIVIVTEDYPLPGEQFDVVAQTQRVQQALALWPEQVIVVAMRSDYELADYANLGTYVCAYSSRPISAQHIARLLSQ